MGSHPALYITKKGALDSLPQVIKFAVASPWWVVLSGTPASSTTKSGCQDIAEILLKVALNTKNQSKINQSFFSSSRNLHTGHRIHLRTMMNMIMIEMISPIDRKHLVDLMDSQTVDKMDSPKIDH